MEVQIKKPRRKNTRVANRLSEVSAMHVKCGNCGITSIIPRDKISVYGSSEHCDGCMSEHGFVSINCKCPFCNQNLTLDVESW